MTNFPNGLHGAYRRDELSHRLGDSVVRSALACRRLIPFTRSVLVDSRRATEFRTRAAGALLAVGNSAVLAGHTALVLHGCSAAGTAPIHLVVPYQCRARSRQGVRVHRGIMLDIDVQDVDGLRVAAPDHALAEVLCRGARRDGIACADEMLRHLPDEERAEFKACVAARIMARPDPRGRRQSLQLIELATGLPESPPESWTLLMLVDGGFPPPEPQFRVADIHGRERHRVDFAWPELRILVEYDGYASHEGRSELDAARDEDLRRRGWIVIRATAFDLPDPARLLSEVGLAFRARGVAAAA